MGCNNVIVRVLSVRNGAQDKPYRLAGWDQMRRNSLRERSILAARAAVFCACAFIASVHVMAASPREVRIELVSRHEQYNPGPRTSASESSMIMGVQLLPDSRVPTADLKLLLENAASNRLLAEPKCYGVEFNSYDGKFTYSGFGDGMPQQDARAMLIPRFTTPRDKLKALDDKDLGIVVRLPGGPECPMKVPPETSAYLVAAPASTETVGPSSRYVVFKLMAPSENTIWLTLGRTRVEAKRGDSPKVHCAKLELPNVRTFNFTCDAPISAGVSTFVSVWSQLPIGRAASEPRETVEVVR